MQLDKDKIIEAVANELRDFFVKPDLLSKEDWAYIHNDPEIKEGFRQRAISVIKALARELPVYWRGGINAGGGGSMYPLAACQQLKEWEDDG